MWGKNSKMYNIKMQFDEEKKHTHRSEETPLLADLPADKHQPDTFVPECKWLCPRLQPDVNLKVSGSINPVMFSCWVPLMQVSAREESSPRRLFHFARLELWEITPVLPDSNRHAVCLSSGSAVTSTPCPYPLWILIKHGGTFFSQPLMCVWTAAESQSVTTAAATSSSRRARDTLDSLWHGSEATDFLSGTNYRPELQPIAFFPLVPLFRN